MSSERPSLLIGKFLQYQRNDEEGVTDIQKVLVLNTGGTLGMMKAPDDPGKGLQPPETNSHMLSEYCKSNPMMNDRVDRSVFSKEDGKSLKDWLMLPRNESRIKRVAYRLYEYETQIDSSNIRPEHWRTICKDIKENYDAYDGFVVIHGTDTMAYSASVLSFMFENLSKPVVLTGAMTPIYESKSDGQHNLATSILIAGSLPIPEVSIFFRDRLVRGNRAIKRSAESKFGFDSLNIPPLMMIGSQVTYNAGQPKKRQRLFVQTKLNPNVSVLRIHPALTAQVITACLGPPMEGVILHTYGAGNIPSDRKELKQAIEDAVKRGVVVVNCTQCPTGYVAPIYATGTVLREMGVVFLGDMTLEAALAKLMYVLSKKKLDVEQKRNLMAKNIRGEFTEDIGI